MGNSLDLEHRLAQIETLALFRATVVSVENRIRELMRTIQSDRYWKVLSFIHHVTMELHMAGQWPKLQPDLNKLLGLPEFVEEDIDPGLSCKPGTQNDLYVVINLLELVERVRAIELGHHEVEYHHANFTLQLFVALNTFKAVLGQQDFVSHLGEQGLGSGADDRLVVHHENGLAFADDAQI